MKSRMMNCRTLLHMHTRTCMCGALYDMLAAPSSCVLSSSAHHMGQQPSAPVALKHDTSAVSGPGECRGTRGGQCVQFDCGIYRTCISLQAVRSAKTIHRFCCLHRLHTASPQYVAGVHTCGHCTSALPNVQNVCTPTGVNDPLYLFTEPSPMQDEQVEEPAVPEPPRMETREEHALKRAQVLRCRCLLLPPPLS